MPPSPHQKHSHSRNQNAIASTSAVQNIANPNFESNEQNNCDAGKALSDSDDSINDDDSLLKNCILMGIQARTIEPGELCHTKYIQLKMKTEKIMKITI